MRLQSILSALVVVIFALVLGGGAYDVPIQSPQTISGGPLLSLLNVAQDASTECSDSSTDNTYSTGTTASLPCANTGEVVLDGLVQINVTLEYDMDGGSSIGAQCDKTQVLSATGATMWVAVPRENAGGVGIIRDWTWAASGTGRRTFDFPVLARMLRCRFWAIGGTAPTLKYNMHISR